LDSLGGFLQLLLLLANLLAEMLNLDSGTIEKIVNFIDCVSAKR